MMKLFCVLCCILVMKIDFCCIFQRIDHVSMPVVPVKQYIRGCNLKNAMLGF